MTRARSLSQLANSSVFTVATNNRVGIGSEVPTAKLDVDGTLNVSGNATIGGVATYEDVTNVDSVGIVTARSGVSVPDGQKIQLGNSNDLQIYHTGSHSLIDEAGTGNLVIRSNLISFEKYTNEQLARFTADGSCELFHDNSKKFETTSTGVNVTGAGTFSGLITANGNILSNRTGSTQTVFQGTLSGVTKVNIQAGGAATFGQASNSTNNNGILLGADVGQLNLYTTRYSTDCFQILNTSGSGTNVAVRFDGDGTATFAGDVTVATAVVAGSSSYLSSPIQATTNKSDRTAVLGINHHTSGDVFEGRRGDTNATTSRINALGAAEFVGRVDAGSSTLDNAAFVGSGRHATKGVIQAYHYNNGSVWVAGGSDGVTKSEITAAGAATFAGQISTSSIVQTSRFGTNVQLGASSTEAFRIGSAASGTIRLRYDGSAEFQGPIKTRQDSNSALAFAVTQGGTANSDSTIRFDGDGSATFANTVMRGTYSSGSSTVRGSILGDGMVSAQQPAANSGSAIVWQGLHGTSITSKITAAGNVTLLGTYLQVGGVNTGNTNTSGAELYKSGVFYVQRTAAEATSARIFSSWHGSTENVAMFAGGDVTFNGKLDVGKTYTGAEIARFGKTASGATSYLAFHTANANYGFIGSGQQLISGGGAGDFSIRSQGNLLFSANGHTEGFRLDTSGRIGINITPSGNSKLQVNGSMRFAGSGTASDSTNPVIYRVSGQDTLAFATSGSERMRITSGGVMQMGDPSGSGNGGWSVHVSDPGTSHQRGRTAFYSKSTTASSQEVLQVFLGSTAKLLIRADGNLYNAAGGIGTLSDAKLKENIVDATSQWNDIKSLRIRKYNFKEETGHDTHTQIGLVAQEVETVSPGLVYDQPDKDEESNDLGTVTKVVNTSVLYMKAVKALQEAMVRIETLEAEVAALKAS